MKTGYEDAMDHADIAAVPDRPDGAGTPLDDLVSREMARAISLTLSRLCTPREERVLRMLYGVGTDRARTMDEVGRGFSVTAVRIQGIRAKALRKLRRQSRLREFL